MTMGLETFRSKGTCFVGVKKQMMLNSRQTNVLIYAAPGLMRDSLCSLLSSFPGTQIAGIASSEDDLLKEVRHLHPDIILIDYPAPPPDFEALHAIKTIDPHHRCVVIIDQIHRKERAYQAGADHVLIRGYSGQEFRAVILENFERSDSCRALTSGLDATVMEGSDESL